MSNLNGETTLVGTTPDIEEAVNGTTSNEGYEELDADSDQPVNTDDVQVKQRKSSRERVLTDRMMENMEQEAAKREERCLLCFDRWKLMVKEYRQTNKTESNEEVLGNMIDNITKLERDVLQAFEHFRSASDTPPQGIVRKVDACVAISKDLISAINEKISGFEDSAFNLRNNKYAKSVFSDLTLSSVSESDSVRSQLSAKYIDAAADLAFKKVELESIKREEENQKKFQALQEQQRQLLEAQQREVRKLQVEKSVAIAEAKLQAYLDLLQG